MEFRDLTDPDKLIATGFKVMFILFALLIGFELLGRICSSLSAPQALAVPCSILFLSPAAYLLLRKRLGGAVRHERRGAERTPVLPAMEDDHE